MSYPAEMNDLLTVALVGYFVYGHGASYLRDDCTVKMVRELVTEIIEKYRSALLSGTTLR